MSSLPRSQVRDLYSSFGSFFACLMSAVTTVRVMQIRRALPHPALRGIVRSFEERRLNFGTGSLYWPELALIGGILEHGAPMFSRARRH